MPRRAAPWPALIALAATLAFVPEAAHAAAGTTSRPVLQGDPIPRAVLFGNSPRTFSQFSPDGRRISWLAPDEQGVQNVWVQGVGCGPATLPRSVDPDRSAVRRDDASRGRALGR